MLDDRRRAEAWKRRALDAERQRDQAEAELSRCRATLRELVAQLERFMFAAARPPDAQ